jgi:hypothetical protein
MKMLKVEPGEPPLQSVTSEELKKCPLWMEEVREE